MRSAITMPIKTLPIKLVLLLIILIIGSYTIAQDTITNIVPNSSFEGVKTRDFSVLDLDNGSTNYKRYLREWTNPNLSSPDLFYKFPEGIQEDCNRYNVECNAPLYGKFLAGIIIYGNADQADEWREYLQVKLSEPIKPKRKYLIEFYVVNYALNRGAHANNIGFAFSKKPIEEATYSTIDLLPVYNHEEMIENVGEDWYKISTVVSVNNSYKYLVIGNFYKNADTKTNGTPNNRVEVLIDNVKAEPIPEKDKDGKTNESKAYISSIEFGSNESTFKTNDSHSLKDVIAFLNANPQAFVNLKGHTDNVGNEQYNLALSKKRAESVKHYLVANGIADDRILLNYFGEQTPINSNDSETTRKHNRRVEIICFKK